MPGQDSSAVRKRAILRIIELLQPLLAENKFRKITRTKSLSAKASILPSIHVVIGDDVPAGEDSRGYISEFTVAFDLIVQEARDPFTLADDSEAFIQEKIEADPQLLGGDTGTGMVRRVTWQGSSPYTTDDMPQGGTILTYSIQYGRERGNPSQNY